MLGAARQSGHIAVEVAGDLYVSWDPKLGVRQVEQLPESLRGEDLVAGFEYFVQPCSLKARVTPRTTRVSVEPEYLLLVDAAQVQLEGTLRYTVRGKKALVLDVALGDWEFDEVGPENLVAVDGVEVTESGLLSIPLVQPSTGQIELKLKAHRRIPQQTKSLRLTFPQPKVTSPGPAAVVILPADNVQLTPDAQATVGLVRQEVAAPMKLPKRQQTPLFYRGEVARAAFVADRVVHAQAIAVNVRSQVTLEGSSGGVQQRLSYQIDYEPQGKLTLAVPRSLVGSEGLAFQLDGQALPATAITEAAEPKAGDSETMARIEIALAVGADRRVRVDGPLSAGAEQPGAQVGHRSPRAAGDAVGRAVVEQPAGRCRSARVPIETTRRALEAAERGDESRRDRGGAATIATGDGRGRADRRGRTGGLPRRPEHSRQPPWSSEPGSRRG